MTKAKAATLSQVSLAGYWLLLVVATHVPATMPFLPGRRVDKLYHAAAFALLAVLLATAWTFTLGRVTGRVLGGIVFSLALYGVVDELTQPLFGRACSIYDWLADIAGAAVGVVLFVWLRGKFETRCRPETASGIEG